MAGWRSDLKFASTNSKRKYLGARSKTIIDALAM